MTVAADAIAPKVSLIANYNFVNIGEPVTFQARATDNIKVEGLQLLINGNSVAIDSNGMATVSLDAAGVIEGRAIATDAAGNEGVANISVQVIDASDTSGPNIGLDLSAIAGNLITSPTEIKGTFSDSNLDYYKLEVAPIAGGEFTKIFRSSTPVEDGVLGTFDPSVLQNDSYILRLTAFDKNGNGSTVEDVVNVGGDLKLGNFRLSFTDLEIPVSGIPITVTRTYDTLNSKTTDELGYGWRLEFRDTDLRTSLKPPNEEQQLLGVQNPFKDGTRVYITLPGGKRTGFTFKPTGDRLNSFLGSFGGGAANWYHPAFVADDGSGITLSVPDVRLIKGADSDEYYGLSGQPYNPADTYFGGSYTLTTKEGIAYEIDGKSGDLLYVTDTNGNKLTFSDAGIKSSTGKEIVFGRDAKGRIISVTDPEGKQVKYEYDAKGDLVAVRDREDNTTMFVYDDPDRPHFLTELIDPLGRTGVRSEYDESGRLKKMLDVNGEAVEMVYDPDNSTQTVLDVFGKPTTYVYDDRGNILTEIDPVGQRIERTYDDDNNVETETVITSETGLNGYKTEYTYDAFGNKLTEKDPLGNVTRWTYNSRGQVLTETDPLGNTTTYTYSRSGNLLSTVDAALNVTKFDYNLRGNLLSFTDANKKVTKFTYNQFGNVETVVDALGNKTTYTYDKNGNRETETRYVTTPKGIQELVTEWKYDDSGRLELIIGSPYKLMQVRPVRPFSGWEL